MPSRVKSRRERLAGRPVLLTALGLIAIQTAIRAWQTVPASYLQDDYIFLRFAREQGFTLDYLFQGWNGHLQPIGFAMTWVLAQFPGNFLPAAGFIVLLQLLASLSLLLLLREVVGERWQLLVGLSVYLFSPLTQANVIWWASFIITIPVQLTLALCGYCHLRFLRTRNPLWVVATVAVLLLGFGFTEKCVVVPVFLFLLTILDARGGVRDTVRTMLRLWPAWLVYAAANIAYLATYFRRVGTSSSRPIESVADLVSLVQHQVWDVFAVGVVGGPWHASFYKTSVFASNSLSTRLIVAQIVLAFAVLAWVRRGPRSLVGWAVLAAYLALNIAITGSYRGDLVTLLEGDIRYITDALPLAAVVVAVLLTPTRPATRAWDAWLRRNPSLMTGLAILFLFNSSLVTLSRSVPDYHDSYVAQFVANVREEMARDPDLDLVDGPVPFNTVVAISTRDILDAYDLHPRYDVSSENLRILDESGNAWPVVPTFASNALISHPGECGVKLGQVHHEVVRFDRFVTPGRKVIRLSYFTNGHGVLRLTTPSESYEVGLDVGARKVVLVVEGGFSWVHLSFSHSDGTVCVDSIAAGYPAPDTSGVQ